MKKRIIIQANCQGNIYYKKLMELLSDSYDVYYFANFEKVKIDLSLLNKCDVFIYQYLEEKWGELSSENLLNIIPKNCIAIRIPKASVSFLWPFDVPKEQRFVRCIEYPNGLYPYGDSLLIDLMKKYNNICDIVKSYIESDFSKIINLDHIFEKNMIYLKAKENSIDIDISKIVSQNYRNAYLFNSFNHPGDMIFNYIFLEILKMIGCEDRFQTIVSGFEYFQVPIHPSVIDFFKLKFVSAGDVFYIYCTKTTIEKYLYGYVTNTPIHNTNRVNALNAVTIMKKILNGSESMSLPIPFYLDIVKCVLTARYHKLAVSGGWG